MKKTLCLFIILVMCLCLIPAYAYNESSKDIIPQPSFEPGPTIGLTLSPVLPTDDPHLMDPLGPDEDGFWTSGLYDVEIPDLNRMYALLNQNYTMPYPLYEIEPEDHFPYNEIGVPLTEALDKSLLRLNMMREMAGLYLLEYSSSNNTQAQYAAFIGKVNGIISHYPSQPADFSDALYQACAWACARSNLAGPGYQPIRAIDAYMSDHQSIINLNTVGHRRNILKPSLKYIGIGQVWDFNALFVADNSYGNLSTNYDTIAYPAANSYMPLGEIFWEARTPWYVTFNNRFFTTPNLNDLTVHIEKNGKIIWENAGELLYNNNNLTGPYMIIDDAGYGTGGKCLIFRPDVTNYTPGEYIVYINGLYNRRNEPIDFKYKVYMFDPNADETCPLVYTPGDVDQDGIISVVDALIIMRYSMGLLDSTSVPCAYIGDIDENGEVNATDALIILRIAMQLT